MRTVIFIILLCAASVGAAWWIQHLVGDVGVTIGHGPDAIVVHITLSWAVPVLLLTGAVLYLAIRLVATIFGLPGAFRRMGEGQRRRRGEAAITSTLIALAARDPSDARREAARAIRLLGETPQTLLLRAYAGSISGNDAEAETAFTKLSERKDGAFLGLRGLLRLAIAREDYARAAVLAREAEAAHPGAAWLRGERTQLALRTNAWSEALQLTQDDAPKAGFGAAAADAETNPSAAHKLAKQAYKRDPTLAPAAIAYARRLREGGREKQAQEILRRCWTAAPNPDLATFALALETDPKAKLNAGIVLVGGAPDHPESHLLLARLYLDAGLTKEAQDHVDQARAAGLTQRRVHLLLADIAEAEGNEAAQRDALRAAAMADADPAWRCEACGTTPGSWRPACPVCHTAGRVRWAVPSLTAPIASLGYNPMVDEGTQLG